MNSRRNHTALVNEIRANTAVLKEIKALLEPKPDIEIKTLSGLTPDQLDDYRKQHPPMKDEYFGKRQSCWSTFKWWFR